MDPDRVVHGLPGPQLELQGGELGLGIGHLVELAVMRDYDLRDGHHLSKDNRNPPPADVTEMVAWDLGANVGRFSQIAARLGRRVVAWDVDPAASERHYQRLKTSGETLVLPLVQDIVNPSPGLGWAGAERAAFVDRSDADVVLALGLLHHLAISNNVPLEWIASLFARLAPSAIVEFVPKDDPMVRRLLGSRRDVFLDYTQDGFERAFGTRFRVLAGVPIPDSGRIVYRMERT